MGKGFKQVFTADFETTTEAQYKIEGLTRVWSFGIDCLENPKDNYFEGKDIKTFMDLITKSSKKGLGYYTKRVIYFHNLKFDYNFIMYYLINEMKYKLYQGEIKEQPPKTYTMLIDSNGVVYNLRLCVDKKRVVEIKDSLKLLNFKVSEIADAFEVTLEGKRVTKHNEDLIDYDKIREVGYEPTFKEKLYQFKDCYIMAVALRKLFELTGIQKSTIASTAMAYYKKNCIYNSYNDIFPNLSYECWDFCKNAYNGGWCYVNPRIQEENIKTKEGYNYCGFGIDKNSHYPTIMHDYPLPYGDPLYFEGNPPNSDAFIVRIFVKGEVYEDKLPYFRENQFEGKKGNYYPNEIEGYITITNYDLEMLELCYDIEELEFFNGYSFDTTTNLFKNYIDYWYNIKATTKDKVLRQIAKLMLNSLYGKFGANYEHINKYTILDSEGNLIDIKSEVKLDTKLSYIPVAVFITSIGRYLIVKDSIKLGVTKRREQHAYTDTDSIKFIYDFNTKEEAEQFCISRGVEIDSTKLGAYKVENLFRQCKFLRAKSYIYDDATHEQQERQIKCKATTLEIPKLLESSNHRRVKHYKYINLNVNRDLQLLLCGAPQNSKDLIIDIINKEGFEAFDYGLEVGGKLRPVRVKGGVILSNINFSLNKASYFGF